MMTQRFLAVACLLAVSGLGSGQSSKEELRAKLKDNKVAERWIYDDLNKGFAQAKQAKKPLLVVLRCVP